jgi:lipopolysaccharide export system protein LptA
MSPSSRSLKALVGATLCACGLLAAGSAWALKTDKNQPINIHADHAEFKTDPRNAANGTGIYTGHVVITQGSIEIDGDKAVFHVINNDLDSAEVHGNPVDFTQQPDTGEPMHGQSQELTYDVPKNEITLITSAKLTQTVISTIGKGTAKTNAPGLRLVTADHILYNTDTQHVVAKGASEDERVHISFPPKTTAPGSTTAPGAKVGKAPGARTAVAPPGAKRAAPMVLTPRTSTAPAAVSAAPASSTPGPTSAPPAASTPPPAASTQVGHP